MLNIFLIILSNFLNVVKTDEIKHSTIFPLSRNPRLENPSNYPWRDAYFSLYLRD